MKAIGIICFVLYANVSLGQAVNNTLEKDEGNIYYQAIKEYLSFVKNRNINKDTIYLEEDIKLTSSILTTCGKTKIVLMNAENLKETISKKNAICLYRIFPLDYFEGEFSVSLIPFAVNFDDRKKEFKFINAGDYRVCFKFDGKKFVFAKVIQHSI